MPVQASVKVRLVGYQTVHKHIFEEAVNHLQLFSLSLGLQLDNLLAVVENAND